MATSKKVSKKAASKKVAKKTSKKKVAKKAATRKGTKAEQVRQMIATAKRGKKDQAAVIDQVVAKIGFTRSLATAYVKNNWGKVSTKK